MAPPMGDGGSHSPLSYSTIQRLADSAFAWPSFKGLSEVKYRMGSLGENVKSPMAVRSERVTEAHVYFCCQVGGSDSLSIRPGEGLGSADRCSKYEFHSLRV